MRRASAERGQAFLIIVVFIAFFLLAVVGLSMDYSQIWAHRQMVQGAADAACQAGAADLYLKQYAPALSGTGGLQNFSWIGSNGSSFNCSGSNSGSPPCLSAGDRSEERRVGEEGR